MDTDKTREKRGVDRNIDGRKIGKRFIGTYSCHQFSCPVVFRCPKSVFTRRARAPSRQVCVHLWFSCHTVPHSLAAVFAAAIISQNFGFCWSASSSATFKPERKKKSLSVCRLRIRCTSTPSSWRSK